MAVNLGTIISESIDRLVSKGGAIVYLLEVTVTLSLLVGVATAVDAALEWALEWTMVEFGDELSSEERAEIETLLAEELPLAVDGIPGVGAVALIGVALLASVAVMVVAFRTFAQEDATGIGPLDGFGLAFFNLLIAIVLYGILGFLGFFALLVGAIIVSFLLLYYFPAVVLGDANALSGLRESISIAIDEPGTTAIIWVLLVGVLIGFSIVGSVFEWVLPSTVGSLSTVLFASAGYVAYYAVATRAYLGLSR